MSIDMWFFLHKSQYVSTSKSCVSIDVPLFFVRVLRAKSEKLANTVRHTHYRGRYHNAGFMITECLLFHFLFSWIHPESPDSSGIDLILDNRNEEVLIFYRSKRGRLGFGAKLGSWLNQHIPPREEKIGNGDAVDFTDYSSMYQALELIVACNLIQHAHHQTRMNIFPWSQS